jgi:hypothetical protein
MSEHLYLLTWSMVLATVLLVSGMKYFSAIRQARSRVLTDTAYRDLAGKAAAAQSENTSLLSSIQADLAQLNARLAAVEKILKAVE